MVAMATLVTSYHYKANQLQSMQGFGMQRAPKKILKPIKHEKVSLIYYNLTKETILVEIYVHDEYQCKKS